jgi:6-phosphofructokinase 1
VSSAVRGQTGVMATFRRVSNHPYLITYDCADIHGIANQEKRIPDVWIDPNGYDVREELVEYLRPLITDEDGQGIPAYFAFDKTLAKAYSAHP